MAILRTPLSIPSILLLGVLGGCTVVGPDTIRSQSYEVGFRPASYVDRRFANTIPQVLDFSCGAASIATILTFYYEDITSEGEVLSILEGLPGLVDWKQKIADGFSFSDLIWASDKLGYAAQGAEVSLEELSNVEGPVIVHLNKKTFQHFVVLRQITKDAAYVSDPIVGDKILTLNQFADYYTGKALAIWKPGVDLPRNSRLQAVKDGLSVSDSVGATRFQYSPLTYPIF